MFGTVFIEKIVKKILMVFPVFFEYDPYRFSKFRLAHFVENLILYIWYIYLFAPRTTDIAPPGIPN